MKACIHREDTVRSCLTRCPSNTSCTPVPPTIAPGIRPSYKVSTPSPLGGIPPPITTNKHDAVRSPESPRKTEGNISVVHFLPSGNPSFRNARLSDCMNRCCLPPIFNSGRPARSVLSMFNSATISSD